MLRLEMQRRLRHSLICAVAILATVVMDVAPHHHDDFSDLFTASFGDGEIHDADCRTPHSTLHFHADKVRHTETCVACLRQHLQAVRGIALVRIPQSLISRLTSYIAIAHICALNLSKSSRGPPLARV